MKTNITMTLAEIQKQCSDWDLFCKLHGYSVYAVNEGGGHVEVALSFDQAHWLGIIVLENAKAFEEVYPTKPSAEQMKLVNGYKLALAGVTATMEIMEREDMSKQPKDRVENAIRDINQVERDLNGALYNLQNHIN